MIRFIDEVPYGMWFCQHGSGEVCLWEDTTCLSKQGDRVSWLLAFCLWVSSNLFRSQLSTVPEAHMRTILLQGELPHTGSSEFLLLTDKIGATFMTRRSLMLRIKAASGTPFSLPGSTPIMLQQMSLLH